MNSTLKAAGNLGAELGATKAENDRLRGLLRDALNDLQDWKQSFQDANHEPTDKLLARIDAALSQQAEPADTYTAVEMATAAAQGFRDGRAATVKESLTVQPIAYAVFAENGNVACFSTQRDHPSLVALEADGHSVVSLAPIAQIEQHDSDCSTNNRGVPDLLGPCDCSLSEASQ